MYTKHIIGSNFDLIPNPLRIISILCGPCGTEYVNQEIKDESSITETEGLLPVFYKLTIFFSVPVLRDLTKLIVTG